jgi:hypothetical protein
MARLLQAFDELVREFIVSILVKVLANYLSGDADREGGQRPLQVIQSLAGFSLNLAARSLKELVSLLPGAGLRFLLLLGDHAVAFFDDSACLFMGVAQFRFVRFKQLLSCVAGLLGFIYGLAYMQFALCQEAAKGSECKPRKNKHQPGKC